MKNFNKDAVMILICAAVLGAPFSLLAGNDRNDAVGVTDAVVTLDQAVNIALRAVPGTVTKVEFENEDNKTVWEVEVVASTHQVIDLEIDANSGVVLEQTVDSTDDEDTLDRD